MGHSPHTPPKELIVLETLFRFPHEAQSFKSKIFLIQNHAKIKKSQGLKADINQTPTHEFSASRWESVANAELYRRG